MELSIVRDLLDIFLKTRQELQLPFEKMAEEAEESLQTLRPLKIGRDGRLLEWSCEVEESAKGHHHLSHLYGLYPAWKWENSLEFRSAAKKSLDCRMTHGGLYRMECGMVGVFICPFG